MKTSKHKPGVNAPCYSNPDGMYHSFETDINGRMLSVMRTYSNKTAKAAMAGNMLYEALEESNNELRLLLENEAVTMDMAVRENIERVMQENKAALEKARRLA